VSEGGIRGAAGHFADQPTPGLLIVESDERSEDGLMASLEALSEVCQPETKVIVLGALNDVIVYRNLKRQGISEYLPVPLDAKAIVETVVGLFVEPGAEKLGRLVSFMGTSGGAGTSQLSHNVAFQLSRLFDAETAVVDLDLAYGTVGLDFNLDSPQSAAAVLAEPDRIDDAIVQRSMAKYNDNLHILTGPQNLVATADVNPAAAEKLLQVVRRNATFVVADLPSYWSAWTQHVLSLSDEVVLVATPRLSSLRNAKRIAEVLNAKRVNDAPVKIVLTRVGANAKTELTSKDFVTAVGQEPSMVIPYDPGVFELAANNGQMIGEGKSGGKVADLIEKFAVSVSGRTPVKPKRRGFAQIFRFPSSPKKAAAGAK
jgi:pilus assembly protein CpaE